MITVRELNTFINSCQLICDNNVYWSNKWLIGYDILEKYIRVWRLVKGVKHAKKVAHCFINKQTGDVYKALSWNVKTNNKKGNIVDKNISKFMDWYGCKPYEIRKPVK